MFARTIDFNRGSENFIEIYKVVREKIKDLWGRVEDAKMITMTIILIAAVAGAEIYDWFNWSKIYEQQNQLDNSVIKLHKVTEDLNSAVLTLDKASVKLPEKHSLPSSLSPSLSSTNPLRILSPMP
ncbi:unnamed protein product [Prunus armeniaca]